MNKIIQIKFGSHLYGTNTPESDTDYKGVYLPTARQIVLNKYERTINKGRHKEEKERNTKDDIDIEIFSLDRFLGLLAEGQTVALDMLFCPVDMITDITEDGSMIMYEIDTHRNELLNKNVNAFVGYARRQAACYGLKGTRMDALKRTVTLLESLPIRDKLSEHTSEFEALVKECESFVSMEKEPLVEIVMLLAANKKDLMPHLHVCGRKTPFGSTVKLAKDIYGKVLADYGTRAEKAHLNGGKDWKALSHSVRVNSEALELLTTGEITFPRPDRELLIKIKTGQVPFEEVSEMIEKGLLDLTKAKETSTLREEPNRKWIDDFVYEVYSSIVKKGM